MKKAGMNHEAWLTAPTMNFDQDEQVNSEVRKIYCTDDN